MPTPDDELLRHPARLSDVFLAFNGLALQGFGGVLAVTQRELVERRRWLSRVEFLELLSAAQLLPGPNVVNLALMLGDRFFGLRGALSALAGILCVPTVIVLALATAYTQFAETSLVSGMLRGMGAVAAGLIVATALKLIGALDSNPLGKGVCYVIVVLTLLAIAGLRWPLFAVLAGLGPPSVGLAWRRLKP
jgi:chromate transporter